MLRVQLFVELLREDIRVPAVVLFDLRAKLTEFYELVQGEPIPGFRQNFMPEGRLVEMGLKANGRKEILKLNVLEGYG